MASDSHDPRWAEVDALFRQALELDPDAVQGWLEDLGLDPGTRKRLEELLQADAMAGGFLERSADALPELRLEGIEARARADLPDGTVVGRYETQGVLGRGGTSTVYRAARADGTFEQEVAIKVVRSDLRRDELAARMRSERQILASLAHPNVARVFDGGVTDDGRPYLVVELVDGVPIDRYCQRNALELDNRIALFEEVLAAVGHAHRNLVVHRDLKPSNILVTADGRVKLLDFGIAKLLGQGESLDVTVTGARWLTPRYAAPEQILGQPITTATDIHALGAILYELITGRSPFPEVEEAGDGSTGGSRFALEKAICEVDPAPPSRTNRGPGEGGVHGARLRGDAARDLDAIVLKALRKEPDGRFASVDQFAEDLESYRAGRPVAARGGATAYRLRKLVRRNPAASAIAAVLVMTVLGSSVALALSRGALLEERDRAEAAALDARTEAENSQAVITFLSDVFRGRNPEASPSDTVTALELVEWGEERVDTEFDDRPAVRAQLLGVLSSAYMNLGFPDRAAALSREGVGAAITAHGQQSVEHAGAQLRLVNVLRRGGQALDSALLLGRQALDMLERAEGETSPLLVDGLAEVALLFNLEGLPDSAAAYMERSISIQRAAGLDADDLYITLLQLAQVRRQQGDYREAIRLYSEGIPEYRRRHGEDFSGVAAHLNNMAFAQRQAGDLMAADSLYREALSLTARAFGRGHPNAITVGANLASALEMRGHFSAADSVLSENLEALRDRWPPDHWRVGQGLELLGSVRVRAGDAVGSLPLLSAAVANYRAGLGPDHFWTVFADADLGVARIATAGGASAGSDPGTESGQAALDRAYQLARTWHEQGDGRLQPAGVGVIRGLMSMLEAVQLDAEAARFAALLPPTD